jgi:signal transduction histidine kinase/ligand-binding sensor domain-containing protein
MRATVPAQLSPSLVIACLLCLVAGVFGQSPGQALVRQWHVEDGLPSNAVDAIAQTPDGFLWLGTSEGLVRFDGVQFLSFGLRDGVPRKRVFSLVVDRNGALWAATADEVVCNRNGVFTCYKVQGGMRQWDANLAVDAEGNIWAATNRGLARWDSGRFTVVGECLVGLPDWEGIWTSHSGELWNADHDGTWVVWKDGSWAKRLPTPPKNVGPVLRITEDSNGTVWGFSASGNPVRLDSDGWHAAPIVDLAPGSAAMRIAAGPHGEVAIAYSSGRVWLLSGEQFVPFGAIDPTGNEAPATLHFDTNGKLWAGTFSRGLVRLSPSCLDNGFSNFAVAGLTAIRAIQEVNTGVLWLGTEGNGWWTWSNGAPARLELGRGTSSSYADAILRARDGTVYLGSEAGVVRYRATEGGSRLVLPGFERGDFIQALSEDAFGDVWAGSGAGKLYQIRGDHVEWINPGAKGGSIQSILGTPDGAIWYATALSGVQRMLNGTCMVFTKGNGLRVNDVQSLHIDSAGTLWAGTNDGGLARFKNGRFQSLGTDVGLDDDKVIQMVDDSSGRLWLAGPRGLSVVPLAELNAAFDGRAERVNPRCFGLSDGLVSTDFMKMRAVRVGEGQLCFGTRRGMVRVDPGKITFSNEDLRVFIEALRVDGRSRSVPLGSAWPASVDLGAGVAQVEIGFTAPELNAPEHTHFRWRLANFDDNWRDTHGERSVTLYRLPPGRYRFEVIASRVDGAWTAPVALALILRPHYWETWWFRLLCIAGGALAGGAIVREVLKRRNERAQARIEQQRAIEAERTRIARDLHDEIGSNLAALSMASGFILKGEIGEGARQDVTEIGRIARETNDSMHEVLWLMGERAASGIELANQLDLAANRILQGIDVSWRERLETFPTSIGPEAQRQIFLLFKEALSNVVKHSCATKVELASRFRDGELRLVVADNGCGFDVEAVRKGVGLVSLLARAESVGGQMGIESAPGRGTTITLAVSVCSK